MAAPAPQYLVDRWTAADGLPVNGVNTLRRDAQGYLWLATADGLVRFDGRRFVRFGADGARDGLDNNRLIGIEPDADGGLWVRSDQGGLSRFDGRAFHRIGVDDGLPDVNVNVLLRRADGRLLAGTDRGVAAWNGQRFAPWAAQASEGKVTLLKQAADGCVWIGERAGRISRICGERLREHYLLPSAGGDEAFSSLGFDDNGAAFAAGAGGVFRLVAPAVVPGLPGADALAAEQAPRYGGGETVPGADALAAEQAPRHGGGETVPSGRVEPFPHTAGLQPVSLAAWPGGRFLLRNGEGNFLLRDWQARPEPLGKGFPGGRADMLYRAPDGARWTNAVDRVLRGEQPVFAARCGVTGLLFDPDGAVWLGTGCEGLVRLRPRLVEALDTTDSAGPVYGLAQTPDGALWVSGRADGVARWRDGVRDLVLPLRQPERADHRNRGIDLQSFRTLYVDGDGSLWVGQRGVCKVEGGECVRPQDFPEALAYEEVRAMARDGAGGWWIGGHNHLWHGTDGQWQAIPNRSGEQPGPAFVRAIRPTRDGALWFGSVGTGLQRRRTPEAEPEFFDRNDGLSSNAIRDLHEDEEGVLWIVTEDRGLCASFDPQAEKPRFSCLDQRHGLHSDSLHRLIEDDAGRFWINTNTGVFSVARSALIDALQGRTARVHPQVYGESEGMPDREGNGGVQDAGITLADGRIAFPTQKGVAIFDPHRQDAATAPPRVAFEEVILSDGRSFAPTARTTLPPGERSFALRYTGLSQALTGAVYFRYRLLPEQPEWQDVGEERLLRFTRLAPGAHTLEVLALDAASGQAGPVQAATLELPPKLWETGAFRWLAALAVALALALALWQRSAVVRQRQRELEQRVAQRTQELAQQQGQTQSALEQVQHQREEIARLAMSKSRFFANISHELRTPLAVILTPLRDVQRGTALEEKRLAAMLRNGQRLERLIDQMLDLERIEARRFPLHPVTLDLAAALRNIADAFEPLAQGQNIALDAELPETPVAVKADPEQLERVLGNLFSNALKFTPKGGTVRARLSAEGGDTATLHVDDSGPGVPEAWRERIFDRFAQVGSEATRAREGAGLGLSLCREIAQLHGGRLHAEASDLGGARFVLEWPTVAPSLLGELFDPKPGELFDPEPPSKLGATVEVGTPSKLGATVVGTPAEPAPRRDDAADERPLVLLAEDHPDLRDYLASMLSAHYRVAVAADGGIALELARRQPPDVIVTDRMMPNMNGLELAQAVRSDPELAGIPLIFLTALASEEDEIHGLDAGADHYLKKPFDAQVLLAHLRAALHSVQRLRRRFAAQASADAATETAPAAPNAFLQRAIAAMTQRLHEEDLSQDDIARALHVSTATLQRRFRESPDAGVAACLRRLRLERARELLAAGEGSVSEVAYAVGFRSLSRFSHAYRERYGHPPST